VSLRVARSLWESKARDRLTKIFDEGNFQMKKRSVLIAAGLGVLLAGVLVFGGERFHKSSRAQKSGYSTDLNELRGKFNTDKGKVRLVMLLSPT